jgi:general secretion pathway protein D
MAVPKISSILGFSYPRYEYKSLLRIVLCAAMILSFCPNFTYSQDANSTKPAVQSGRYRVFALKSILAEDAKNTLSKLNIGTITTVPNQNTLLITTSPTDLIKVSSILRLLDSKQKYVIEYLYPASFKDKMPTFEQITEQIKTISIGTFMDPPVDFEKDRVIIDTYNDSILAVAPADKIEKITFTIEKLINAPPKTADSNDANAVAVKPVEKKDSNSSEDIFNKVYKKVDKKKNAGAKPKKQTVSAIEPNEAEKKHEQLAKEESEVKQEIAVKTSYSPESNEYSDADIDLTLPEKINIVDLLDLVGKNLNLNIIYDPALVTGEITLKIQGKVKIKDLYPMVESMLKFKNFVMTKNGKLVTVVPSDKMLEADPSLINADGRQVQFGEAVITKIFNLKYIDATSAKNLLIEMKLGASIATVDATSTLIVTDFAFRMERIEELLSIIDKPGDPRKFKFRKLMYTSAVALAPKIKGLVEQMGSVNVTISEKVDTQQPGQPGQPINRSRRITRANQQPGQPPQPPGMPPQQQQQSGEQAKDTIYLDADERTNRILMIGVEKDLSIVENLIDTLDVQKQDLRSIKVYEMQNVGAEEVRDKLVELGIITSTTSSYDSSSGSDRYGRRDRYSDRQNIQQPIQPGQPQPQYQQGGTEQQASPNEEPQVVIIESTNSLLVNATPEQHAQVSLIIGYVDSEPEKNSTPYVVYPLENQDPTKLAKILKDLVEETITQESAGGQKDDRSPETKLPRTQTVSKNKKINENISIIPDPNTYSIIVYADKKNQQWIKSIIKQLDEYRPQVLLDVTLVNIDKNDSFSYDLNIIKSIPNLKTTSGLANTIVPGDPPLTTDDIYSKLQTSGKDQFIDLQSNSGQGTAFYGDEHVMALLKAVQTKNYGRVLAKPKLLVNDNQKGVIESKETTYRARRSSNVTAGNNPVTSEQVVFDDYTATFKLEIEPHISKGKELRLKIKITREAFVFTAASTRLLEPTPPDKVSNNVDTLITVPDSKTIILGGLEKVDQSKGGSKVPILGDIPIVGMLFRNISNKDDQKRLYVFVKAHILRPGEKAEGVSDIERVSIKNRNEYQKFEKQMHGYQDVPGIDSKPMDPLSVLEDDN